MTRTFRAILASVTLLAMASDGRSDEPPRLGAVYQEAMLQEKGKHDPAAAIPLYEQVVARRAEDEKMAGLAQFGIGRCYEQLGEMEKAIATYEKILADFELEAGTREQVREHREALVARREMDKAVAERGMILVDGVPPLQAKPDEKSTLIGSIRAALIALGERMPFGDLMAVSGAAFQLHFYPWDTGSGMAEDLAFANEALFAVGRSGRWLPTYTENAKQEILASLRSGVPVIAQGVVGPPEFGVIAGYDPQAEKWYGRSYHDEDQPKGGYRILERAGWGFLLIGEQKGDPLSEPEMVERAILRGVYVMNSEEEGTPCLHGFGAFQWWAKALRNEALFDESEAEGRIPHIVEVHESTLDHYCAARQNAAHFLRRHADLFSREEAPHANAAAEAYIEAAQTILWRGFMPFGRGHADPEIAEKSIRDRTSRHQMAGILGRVLAKEREAVEHLEAILDLRRESILAAYRKRAEEDAGNPTVWRHLAEAQYVFGQFKAAGKSYRQYTATATSGDQKAWGRLRAAFCVHRAGDEEKAVADLIGLPSLLQSKNDDIIRSVDRRLMQWKAGDETFGRFFEALGEYTTRADIEPYSTQLLIARRKWALGNKDAAREDYRKLTTAPLDWVVKTAEKALRDIAAGREPADALAS